MLRAKKFTLREAVEDTRPSIIVATLPKSGTKYIGSTIARTLGYQRGKSLYFGAFPKNVIVLPMADDYARGGLVLAGHLQADPQNLRHLSARGLTRFVLHVRDPRACTLSRMHYFRTREQLWLLEKVDPTAFLASSAREQLDFHIDRFLSDCIEWLTGWADALERSDIRVMVTTHDELVREERAMFARIFDFYGIQAGELVTAPKDAQRNFRSGDPEEWRRAIAPEQIARMTAMIPERLFETFGWRRSA